MAWIATAIGEAFTRPRVLPSMRRPPAEPAPPLPSLFEGLPDHRRGEPAPAMAAPAPVLDERDFPNFSLMRRILGDAIAGPSQIAVTRRRLKRERAEAAAAACEEAAVPAEPVLVLTRDFGPLTEHDKKPVLSWVVRAPFSLHEEDDHEVADEFLGQVVGIEPARALLFRRSDPGIMDGCDVGQRYVLLRFRDDKDGRVWSMPVEGEDDRSVFQAIDVTVALYRRSRRSSA